MSGSSSGRRSIRMKILDARLGREFPLPEPATEGSAGVTCARCWTGH